MIADLVSTTAPESITTVMPVDRARHLTERIRLVARTYAEAKDKLVRLVAEAKDGNVHVALGYGSWTAYLSEVLGEEPLRLARDDRQDLVGILRSEGMSTRAIAPIVGVGKSTIDRDLATVPNGAVEPGTVITGTVVSLDGRQRPAFQPTPAPDRKPRRTPIGDSYRNQSLDLAKRVRGIEKLSEDDRWPGYVREHPRVLVDLRRAITELQAVVDASEAVAE